MQKDDLVYVSHMLDMARAASAKVAYLIQTIGEAARQVSAEFRELHPEVPWRKITGTRHHIVHDYLNVDFDILWDVVKADLPPLIAQLAQLVPPMDGGCPPRSA